MTWLGHSYLDLSFFFDFLNARVLVTAPIFLRGTTFSGGGPRRSSEDLPVTIEFLGFLDECIQCGRLWRKRQEFLLQDCGQVTSKSPHLGGFVNSCASGLGAPFLEPGSEILCSHLVGMHL